MVYRGKFKTVEDLVGSYKELEGKLGAIDQTREESVLDLPEEETEEQETETMDSEFDAEEYYGDGLYFVLEEVGIDPQDISNRFAENDEIQKMMYR